jgi:hypothetical protein
MKDDRNSSYLSKIYNSISLWLMNKINTFLSWVNQKILSCSWLFSWAGIDAQVVANETTNGIKSLLFTPIFSSKSDNDSSPKNENFLSKFFSAFFLNQMFSSVVITHEN